MGFPCHCLYLRNYSYTLSSSLHLTRKKSKLQGLRVCHCCVLGITVRVWPCKLCILSNIMRWASDLSQFMCGVGVN
ncbi:hypothetical protein ES288_A04G074400v1 [Gossypium darwinii]|uniref:Uncharacterized protein n=1 Tax=Gossypium darwinii TaxID=34276 RepID=A0A5D2GV44_GOSDA|nr:hypothetical protein ES288_A04G074400v1 [Gossypium darwinii]